MSIIACRRRFVSAALGALALCTIFSSAAAAASPADEVLNWNVLTLNLVTAVSPSGMPQSRIAAMVQLAVHDALNAIDHRYTAYAYAQEEDPTASAAAAVATAAHDVLLNQVPSQAAAIATAWAASLGAIPEGTSKDSGIAIGHAAAAAMLQLRSSDGSGTTSVYTPGTRPGFWRPTPNPTPSNPAGATGLLPALFPGWGNVTPFVLRGGAQFRPDGPPALRSGRYARDFNEVKDVGEQFTPLRTSEQSTIARFWYEGSHRGWSRIARNLAIARSLDAWDTARLLALVHAATADGFIAGFNAKYHFNFWRPVTAIREAATDGNDHTVSDPDWNTYLNTPAIPEYPSTHSVLGSAAAEVLARFFGTDEVSFTTTSGPPFAGITRSFTSFSQAAGENGDSRIFAGIHFRSGVRDGMWQGRKIGKFTFRHALEPVNGDADDDADEGSETGSERSGPQPLP